MQVAATPRVSFRCCGAMQARPGKAITRQQNNAHRSYCMMTLPSVDSVGGSSVLGGAVDMYPAPVAVAAAVVAVVVGA